MVGAYIELEKAKQMLKSIKSGKRFIAEVDGLGRLTQDPHYVVGEKQLPENGFYKTWGDWNGIHKLLALCRKYLDGIGNHNHITY